MTMTFVNGIVQIVLGLTLTLIILYFVDIHYYNKRYHDKSRNIPTKHEIEIYEYRKKSLIQAVSFFILFAILHSMTAVK